MRAFARRGAAGLVLAAAVAFPGAGARAQGLWLPPDLGGNNPVRAVAVGDSITEGVVGEGGVAARPYPAALQALLAPSFPGLVVLNRGVGGETTGGGLDRLATVLAQDRPLFALLMEGTNDATFRADPGEIVANLRAMIQVAKAHSVIPILGAIIPNFRPFAPDAQARIDAVNAQLPSVAVAEGVRFVDTFSAMHDPGLFGPDILHPNQAGYDQLGAAWAPALADTLVSAQALQGGVTVAGAMVGGQPAVMAGAGPGLPAQAREFRLDNGPLGPVFLLSSGFIGGVRVAGCDLDGDGVDDLVTGAGPGASPLVVALRLDTSGDALGVLASFLPYDPGFTGGISVACGDLDGDGVPEIVVGAGRGGGPHVRALRYAGSGAPGGVVATEIGFFPYDPGFTGGVEVAVGNFDGDPGGHAEIAVGAGPGGGPHIRVFRYVAGAPGGVADFGVSFFPYDPGFVGGVHLAAGDVDGDGRAELVTGTGVGGGPHVRVFRAPGGGPPTELGGFFAYSPAFRGGVWVGVAGAQIVTGAGPGGGAHVRGFSPAGTPTALNVIAY